MNGSRRTARSVPPPLAGRVVGIVGLGQIGGSLVRRLGRYRPSIRVVGFDRRGDLAARAGRHCEWCDSLDRLVAACDIVILAVPVPAVVDLLPKIATLARKRIGPRRLVVMDVGSVKVMVAKRAARLSDAFDYVGLHPLAGGERNGWDAADADLFEGRTFVYCPTGRSADRAARALIGLTGGVVRAMSAKAHDKEIAELVGLPHLLAFAAAGLAVRRGADATLRGGSWRSLTRVAASDWTMVAGFLHGNAVNQRRAVRMFVKRLDELDRLLSRRSIRPLERKLRAWQGRA